MSVPVARELWFMYSDSRLASGCSYSTFYEYFAWLVRNILEFRWQFNEIRTNAADLNFNWKILRFTVFRGTILIKFRLTRDESLCDQSLLITTFTFTFFYLTFSCESGNLCNFSWCNFLKICAITEEYLRACVKFEIFESRVNSQKNTCICQIWNIWIKNK